MGIYIFTWEKLRAVPDGGRRTTPTRNNDFGKNIIPTMLDDGRDACAPIRFEGYWKDVGTIDSLWEANMDLLDPDVPLDLYDTAWQIYARNPGLPPALRRQRAPVCRTAMITEGCDSLRP